jgi:hypothetical protein
MGEIEFALDAPPVAPIAQAQAATHAPLRALGGIDWQGLTAEAGGQIALVEVDPGEGELQEWGKRGE